jgi:gluconate 5-dehydrogenase
MTGRFDIAGRTALITGSSRGIGFAIARGLAAEGVQVVLHGRDESTLEVAAETIREESGIDPVIAAFDVTDGTAVAVGLDIIESRLGPLDILVNNAGIQRRFPFLEFPEGDWNDVISANLTSAFLVGQRVARGMASVGRGKIVNIASLQSSVARATTVPYAASKGGIAMLTRGMCSELAAFGIQVNAIAPGYIATEINRVLQDDEEFNSWIQKRTPAGRWGSAEDLVGTAVFLASPAADFINGQILYVDGGFTAVM